MTVLSPISEKVALKTDSINTENLAKKYYKAFNIEVSKYFHNAKEISVYECQETGYKFYYPFNLTGDSAFYEHMQHFDWYYMPWKWEHKKAAEFINPGMKVLEVGCAKGDFLKKIKQTKNAIVTGLEYNESVQNEDIKILNESIQEHAKRNENEYDLICSFQVLEHVPDVIPFLKSKIECLKPGGKLIISVPNNESFIKNNFDNNILNMPPHHLGLWDKNSLSKVTNYIDVNLDEIIYEPLQEYHFDWYINIMEKQLKKKKLLNKIYHKFKLRAFTKKIIKKTHNHIKGHSVIAIYSKK